MLATTKDAILNDDDEVEEWIEEGNRRHPTADRRHTFTMDGGRPQKLMINDHIRDPSHAN